MTIDYQIRMITAHLDCRSLEDPVDAIYEYTSSLGEAGDRIASETGASVWSKRLVLDHCEDSIDEILGSAPYDDVLVSLGGLTLGRVSGEVAGDLAENELFFSILLRERSWEEARRVSEVIHEVADREPSLATHFGVNTLGERLETPYFPLATTPRHGVVTAGLLYPKYLLNAYRGGGYRGLVEAIRAAGRLAVDAIRIAADETGLSPGGVDLSPSPWMEESTLALVEFIAGVRMPEPGLAHGIALVNKAVGEAAAGLPATGFNEVQLPVAEDLKLKARVSELETTARDLARYSGACLAGLDLVVVPANRDWVAGLILEVSGYALTKGKPLGVRIIPVEGVEPGDKVYLEKFGETPVIPL